MSDSIWLFSVPINCYIPVAVRHVQSPEDNVHAAANQVSQLLESPDIRLTLTLQAGVLTPRQVFRKTDLPERNFIPFGFNPDLLTCEQLLDHNAGRIAALEVKVNAAKEELALAQKELAAAKSLLGVY